MNVTASPRRLSACVIGVVGVLALTVSCSSSSNGKPLSPGSVAASASVQSSAAPVSSLPGGTSSSPITLPSSAPVLGGSGSSQFCKDLTGQGGLANVGNASDINKLLSVWDKLTTEAPAEIKTDVQAIDDYLHNALKGKIDPTAAQNLSTAAAHVGTYVAANCH